MKKYLCLKCGEVEDIGIPHTTDECLENLSARIAKLEMIVFHEPKESMKEQLSREGIIVDDDGNLRRKV
ncbi:MAG: hypothetical protein K8R40_02395 [Anaerolineaceae bacterium]|nr:hypothetical protein [Anaerolineaceae bacterium]